MCDARLTFALRLVGIIIVGKATNAYLAIAIDVDRDRRIGHIQTIDVYPLAVTLDVNAGAAAAIDPTVSDRYVRSPVYLDCRLLIRPGWAPGQSGQDHGRPVSR